MIVRNYGRRSCNNSLTRNSYSDSDSPLSDNGGSGGGFENSHSQPQEDIYSFNFCSQDSIAQWSFDSDPYNFDSSQNSRQLANLGPRKQNWLDDDGSGGELRKAKKLRHAKKEVKSLGIARKVIETATLMKTREVREMMEHVDEVDFALDGLRKGQPVRIRRANLLSC